MFQEGHMKDLECILGDSRILAEQLLRSLIPRCGDDVIATVARSLLHLSPPQNL